MAELVEVINIKACVTCRFKSTSMDGMECSHPYWDDKGAYENMIISHDIKVSEKCPLRDYPLTIKYRLEATAQSVI